MTRQKYFKRALVYGGVASIAFFAMTQAKFPSALIDRAAVVVYFGVFFFGIFDLIFVGNRRREDAGQSTAILDENICPIPGVPVRFISFLSAAVIVMVVPFFLGPLLAGWFNKEPLAPSLGLAICAIALIPMAQKTNEQFQERTQNDRPVQ
ncbi:MAG: hypothetical protein AAF340_10640 [Pseudomonadota bacterium]